MMRFDWMERMRRRGSASRFWPASGQAQGAITRRAGMTHLELRDLVLPEPELLEAGEAVEVLDPANAVAAELERLEGLEGGQVVDARDLVLHEIEGFECGEGRERWGDGAEEVEGEIERLELGHVPDRVADVFELVVVQVELLELGEQLPVGRVEGGEVVLAKA